MEIKENTHLPGFFYALILIVLAGIITMIFTWGVSLLGNISPLINSWTLFLVYTLSFGVTLLIAQKWWQVDSFDSKTVNIMVYLLLIPMIIAMAIITESVVSQIPMPEKIQQMFEQMVQLNFQGYLTIAIAAPILEELIFRGVVLKKFLQKYSPTKAIILSSVIFGIAHLNPWQFVGAFAIGLFIGWIYWKTKSVWPGIFMHFANNSFSFYLAKKYESINITFNDIIGNTTYYISLIILCILICYSIFLILRKYFESNQNISEY